MLRNVSYNNRQITREINVLVGAPYSIMERLKMRGNGSPRLVIVEASKEVADLIAVDNRRPYANIEIRPAGIIVGFRSRLESYALVIPYHKLVIYKGTSDVYSIFSETTVVKMKEDASDRPIHRFMSKVMAHKNRQAAVRIEDL